MEKYLTAAVIGCGRMGAFTNQVITENAPPCWFPLSHADAISAHPRVLLKAMCDIDQKALNCAAEKYGIQNQYKDPVELLNNEKPNILSIATRTLGRAQLIQAAVDRGTRAIHTEKPLCNSVNELKQLQKLFNLSDLYVTWGAIRRFFSIYKQALNLANSGRYGVLREVRVNLGSGLLFWTHPHSIDLLLFAASGKRVEGVQARLSNFDNKKLTTCIESDPKVIAASVYFEGGLAGHITQAIGSDLILSCEYGEIAVRSDGWSMDIYSSLKGIYPEFSALAPNLEAATGGTLAPISHLVNCLEGEQINIKENKLLKKDIITSQLIMFAMIQSQLESSRVIELTEVDYNLVVLGGSAGKFA